MAKESEILVGQERSEHGETLIAWDFLPQAKYERGWLWYSAAIVVGIALLIYALLSANFLFALIIIMIGLVLFITSFYEPSNVRTAVTEEGIQIGSRFYPYRDIAKFWFYYDPPEVKSLYIEVQRPWPSRLRVDMANKNPNEVREGLSRFLKEDLQQTDEPLSDVISRLLKL